MMITEKELAKAFAYLDNLRDSGVINMFGAGAYLKRDRGYSRAQCSEVLLSWMETFDDDKTPKERAKEAIAKATAQ